MSSSGRSGDASLTAPLQLPATAGKSLTTQGGSTLDDGAGGATFYSNVGFNGSLGTSSATPAAWVVPASGVAGTVDLYSSRMLVISGGAVTVIKINGVTTGLTSGTFYVPSSFTVAITYTVVPTAIEYPL